MKLAPEEEDDEFRLKIEKSLKDISGTQSEVQS